MCKKNLPVVIALVFGLLLAAIPAWSAPLESARLGWGIYEDEVLDYAVQYPPEWTVAAPPALSGLVSPVLTFRRPVPGLVKITSADPHARSEDMISVGQYLHAIEADETLLQWVERYNEAFTDGVLLEISPLDLGRHEAVYARGESALTGFHFVNIRVGQTVWFLWSNFDAVADHPGAATLRRMARSLTFGPQTPQTLQARYGQNFEPPKLEGPSQRGALTESLTWLSAPLSSSWYSPVLKSYGNQWSITCGSSYHTNGAYYAADVGASSNWAVLAAKAASVYASGWDNSGYGNRVKLGPSSGYYHYYAHLIGIFWPVTAGTSVSRGDLLGWVGSSGTSATHLHFHVQNGASQGSSTGIDLRGMTGFTDSSDSWYPSNDGTSHYSCAWMGR